MSTPALQISLSSLASNLHQLGGNWADVRDVALAHVKALTLPEAGGERFLVSAGPFAIQDLTEWLRANAPQLKGIPEGKPGAAAEAKKPENTLICSGEKAERVLGIKYRSIQETTKDMYESLKRKGWLE